MARTPYDRIGGGGLSVANTRFTTVQITRVRAIRKILREIEIVWRLDGLSLLTHSSRGGRGSPKQCVEEVYGFSKIAITQDVGAVRENGRARLALCVVGGCSPTGLVGLDAGKCIFD